MTFRKALVAIPAGAVLAAAVIAPVATSAHAVSKHAKHVKHVKHVKHHAKHAKHHARKNHSKVRANDGSKNVTCSTIFTGSATNLSVPSGKTCTLTRANISGNVTVNSGATLIDTSSTIGNDINATSPKGMGITGSATARGSVGNDIIINGTSGAAPGGANYICYTNVKMNLSVENSTSTAGPWYIGDSDGCGGGASYNLVIQNLTAENNQDNVDVSDNQNGQGQNYDEGVDMNMTVEYNKLSVVENNFVGGNASCTNPKRDGDSFSTPSNMVQGMNSCG